MCQEAAPKELSLEAAAEEGSEGADVIVCINL